MHITLMGSGAADGWPGLFCGCHVCANARKTKGKNLRTRTSGLINGVLKIDFPPDILHQVIASNYNLRCMKALLFTHSHDDHFAPSELQYRGLHFLPEPITDPLDIYGPEAVISVLQNRLDPELISFRLHTLVPWKTVTILGEYEVTPILAQHDPSTTCFNFIIRDASGSALLWASDTGWYHEETWTFLEGKKLTGMLVECTKGMEEGGYMAHLCIPEVIKMRNKLHEMGCLPLDAPVVATHFSHHAGMTHEELDLALSKNGIQAGYDTLQFEV